MQRALKSAHLAKRQAAKKADRYKAVLEKAERKNYRNQMLTYYRAKSEIERNARKVYKQDWALGSLAPRRDYGMEPGAYGALPMDAYAQPAKPEQDREWIPFREGDRVVILRKGDEYGKITQIYDIDHDRGVFRVKNAPEVDIQPYDAQRRQTKEIDKPYVSFPHSYRADELRMVVNYKGKEVIIEKLEQRRIEETSTELLPDGEEFSYEDRLIRESDPENELPIPLSKVPPPGPEWRLKRDGVDIDGRFIYGTNTFIPWPEKEKDPEEEEYFSDTLRMDLEDKTYSPTLMYQPMAEGVIDELRNKYSRLRVRFDAGVKLRKEEKDAAARQKTDFAEASMRTPKQELQAQRMRANAEKRTEESVQELRARLALEWRPLIVKNQKDRDLAIAAERRARRAAQAANAE